MSRVSYTGPRGNFATRYLLPLELFAYAHIIILAFSGGFGQGLLHEVLDNRDHDAVIWLWVLGVVGFTGFAVSITDWLYGREIPDSRLRRWLLARKWSALFGMVVSTYTIYTMLEVPGGWKVASLPWMGAVNATFLFWSWWVNYRAEVLLNPLLSTTTLEHTLATRRGTQW